jgi:hypothetical protein
LASNPQRCQFCRRTQVHCAVKAVKGRHCLAYLYWPMALELRHEYYNAGSNWLILFEIDGIWVEKLGQLTIAPSAG